MKRTEVQSTSLKSAGYDEEKNILEIEFKDGTLYQYFSVPKEIYDQLMEAKSKGKFYNQIKNLYKFRKI